MANHKSAEKRARQSERRRVRNRSVKSRLKTVVKEFTSAVASGPETAAAKLREAEKALRKAASGGVIPKRRASRRVSRLAKHLHKAQSKA